MTDAERKAEREEEGYKTRVSPLEDEKLFHRKVEKIIDFRDFPKMHCIFDKFYQNVDNLRLP